jgi:hypothetical protein
MRVLKALLLFLSFAVPFAVAGSKAPNPSLPSYPNTSAGLEHMMNDMLLLQKKGDSKALAPYLQSLILPSQEHWFDSEFGEARCGETQLGADDCLGPRMALAYRSLAAVLPASFSLTLTDLISEGLTNFEATDYMEQCPGPDRIIPDRELVGGLTTTPYLSPLSSKLAREHEPTYVLWIYNDHKETTLPFFVFSEGAFRYLGMLSPASIEELQDANAGKKRRGPDPSPHYLTEDQIEVKNAMRDPALVSKIAVVQVTVGHNGNPEKVAYLRGPKGDEDIVVQSLKMRHFEPPASFYYPTVRCLRVIVPASPGAPGSRPDFVR